VHGHLGERSYTRNSPSVHNKLIFFNLIADFAQKTAFFKKTSKVKKDLP